MYWLLALNVRWLDPLAALLFARRLLPRWKWALTGNALGAVVEPAALGMYSLYFWGGMTPMAFAFGLCLPVGLVGLALSLFHGEPAYSLSIKIGLIEPGKIVEGVGNVYVALVAGGIWGLIYGLVGCAIDFAITHGKSKTRASA